MVPLVGRNPQVRPPFTAEEISTLSDDSEFSVFSESSEPSELTEGSELSELSGTFACDWITVYSMVEPQSGSYWHGSVDFKRFERLGTNGKIRAQVSKEHGQYSVTLTGEPLRAGARVGELLSDIWSPIAGLTLQRVDWAWESHALPQDWNLERIVHSVKARLPHWRYGWGVVEINSPDGRTFYLGAMGQPGTEADGTPAERTKRWRAKPLFIRCYQRTGGPVRVEAECKKLSGVPLRNALEETCTLCAKFLPGRCGWTEIELPATAARLPDGRDNSAKLVRQAYGLLRAAALRSGYLEDGRRVPAELDSMWAAVVFAATGMTWNDVVPKVSIRPLTGASDQNLMIGGGREGPRFRDPGGVIQGSEMADAIIRPMRSVGKGSISQNYSPTPLGEFFTHFCGED